MRNISKIYLILFSQFCYTQELLKLDNGCNYSGELINTEVYSFSSDNEAEDALSKLMKHTGLPANFIIKAADVPNAQASIYATNRYILYNQLFMIRVKQQTNTDWSAISILAHEIGHHLSGHTLDGLGSRPNKELEADRFSGFILAKMGATIEEAIIAINTIASESGSSTHPPRSARLAAITNGWQAARDIDKLPEKKNIVTKEKEKKRQPITSEISEIAIDHNVYEDGAKGMMIHLKFQVYNMQYIKGRAVAYFSFNDGTKLKDFNGIYCTKNGYVSTGIDFTPNYENSVYKDLQLFIPYSELHMQRGNYSLRFYIKLYELSDSENPTDIGETDYIEFTYSN